MSARVPIEEAAARWLLRREEPDWTASQQAELDAWIEESPEHRMALYRLEYGWAQADRLGAIGQQAARPATRARAGTPWRPWALAAAVGALALLGGVFLTLCGVTLPKTYETEVGGHATVPLADGTKVELNTDTHVRAVVTGAQRKVWLDRGEAYFDVAHDKSRPFVVYAGDRTVTVLGTRFSVRRDGDRVQVSVVEGRVRVDPVPGSRPARSAVVTRGEIVVGQGASTLVAPDQARQVADDLSWRQGMLTFDGSTLADAVAEFNRYNRKKLVLSDAATGRVRVGGAFEAENVDAFARILQQVFGLKVEDEGDHVKISG